MRLITLSLFACLLAVSAFGQSEDPASGFDPRLATVLVSTEGWDGPCAGVLVNRHWVLTVDDCICPGFPDPYVPSRYVPPEPLVHLPPYMGSRGRILPLRTVCAWNLAMVHLPCPVQYDSRHHKAMTGLGAPPSGDSFAAEVVPWGWQANPRINGNAFKGDSVWTVQGLDAELPRYNTGAPLYVNEAVVGIYEGEVGGVATFRDVSAGTGLSGVDTTNDSQRDPCAS